MRSLSPCCLFLHLPLHTATPTPITTGHLCGPKLMGSSPRDGPVATVCLSLSTSNKLRPSHHVGMLMCGTLGGRGDWPTEVPICGRGKPGREEKLIPGARQSV